MLLPLIVLTNQEPLVNLTIAGERLETVAPLITKAVGYEPLVRLNPEYKDQVVVIKVKDVPRSEFLAKLKQSMRLEFFKTKEGTILDLSETSKAEEEKIDRDARSASIDNLFASIKSAFAAKQAAPPTDFKKLEREFDHLFKTYSEGDDSRGYKDIEPLVTSITQKLPSKRAALAIAAALPRSAFNEIKESNPRVVFSSRPNPMQRMLTIDWKRLAQPALNEIQPWNDARSASFARFGRAKSDDEVERSSWGFSLYGAQFTKTNGKFTSAFWDGMPTDGNVKFDSCQVVVACNGSPNIQVRLLDPNGYQVITANFPYDLPSVPKKRPEGKGGIGFEKPEVQKDNPLYEFPKLLQNLYQQSPKNISSELTSKLLNVENNDFLGYCIGPVIVRNAGDRNVIAPIDDYHQYYSTFNPEAAFPFNRYDDKIEKTDRWMIRTYSNPLQERKRQMNRAVLGDLLRVTNKGTNPLTINQKSALMTRARFEWGVLEHFETELNWNKNLFKPANFTSDTNGYQDYNALWLYGQLSDSEKKAASTKEGLDVSLLSPKAMKGLQKLFFHANQYGTWLIYEMYASPNMLGPSRENLEPNTTGKYWFLGREYTRDEFIRVTDEAGRLAEIKRNLREMTDLFPSGLSRGHKLMVGHQFIPRVRDHKNPNSNEYNPYNYFDWDVLGRVLKFQQEPNQLGEYEKRVDFKNLVVDTTESLSIGIKFPDMGQTFGWYHYPRNIIETKTYRFEDLPREIKLRIEKEAQKWGAK